jgi:hypothetical protein
MGRTDTTRRDEALAGLVFWGSVAYALLCYALGLRPLVGFLAGLAVLMAVACWIDARLTAADGEDRDEAGDR